MFVFSRQHSGELSKGDESTKCFWSLKAPLRNLHPSSSASLNLNHMAVINSA